MNSSGSPRNSSEPPCEDEIPQTLRDLDRWTTWVLARNPGGHKTKKPAGSTRDPKNRQAFEQVAEVERSTEGGVGLVLTDGVQLDDGTWLVALDLDACYFEGEVVPWAREVIEAFDCSYAELSPSGHGLRQFVRVAERPDPMSTILVPHANPSDKRCEIQVFGCGPAQYVTVTGNRLPWTSREPKLVGDLSWLAKKYGALLRVDRWAGKEPKAHGEAPSSDEISDALATVEGTEGRVTALINGCWEGLGYPSASEGFQELEGAVLRAARGHLSAAVCYLVDETAYGRGDVESRDPARYGREDWVRDDLCRTHDKVQGRLRDSFNDGFDAAAWEPPGTKPTKVRSRFLQAEEFVERARRAEFLLHGLLPARGIAQVFGDPASGKTAFALSLAVHVAAGLDFCGHQLDRPGRAFYIAGEGLDGLGKRLRAQLRQVDPTMTLGELKLHLSIGPGAFTMPEDRKAWAADIKAVVGAHPGDPPVLIVLDTQARNFGPGNENAAEDMGGFVAQVDSLAREVGALVLLIHHVGHGEKGRGRGSSVLGGALDVAFKVWRPKGGRAVLVDCEKAKDWEEPDRIEGKLQAVELGEDDQGRPITAVTFVEGPVDARDLFPDEIDGAEVAELLRVVAGRLGVVTPLQELAGLLGCSAKVARRRVDDAVDGGWLKKAGSSKNRSYLLTQQALTIVPSAEGTMEDDIFD